MTLRRKLIECLPNMTFSEVLASSPDKLKQLAVDLELMTLKSGEKELEVKGLLAIHFAEKGMGALKGGGGSASVEQCMQTIKDLLQAQNVSMLAMKDQMQDFQTSFSALSGFVDDFKIQMESLGKEVAEGKVGLEEMGRKLSDMGSQTQKTDSRLAALEAQEKENTITVNELAAKILELNMNTTPLPLPPPPAVPQVWSRRLEKLEVAEAVQDRPMQEKVKLDVRISGLLTSNDIDDTPTVDLLSKVSMALGEAVALSGEEMGIVSVRVHRVRAARGGKASANTTSPSTPPPPQVILTCSSLEAKLRILRNKNKTGRGVRISSELTLWQIRQKNLMWEQYIALKGEGNNAFFLGHRLFVQEGEGPSAKRNEILP
jgi:hypothetical protein